MADDDIREGEPDRPRKKKAPPPDDEDDDRPRRRRRDDDEDDEDRPHAKSIRKRGADDGGLGAVIPYRNSMALIAYYTGVFGLILCFLPTTSILGIVPIALGVMGLLKARKDPEARGSAHAWIGIALGALEVLVGCGFIGFFGYAALGAR